MEGAQRTVEGVVDVVDCRAAVEHPLRAQRASRPDFRVRAVRERVVRVPEGGIAGGSCDEIQGISPEQLLDPLSGQISVVEKTGRDRPPSGENPMPTSQNPVPFTGHVFGVHALKSPAKPSMRLRYSICDGTFRKEPFGKNL